MQCSITLHSAGKDADEREKNKLMQGNIPPWEKKGYPSSIMESEKYDMVPQDPAGRKDGTAGLRRS